jgi:hypothetical protein
MIDRVDVSLWLRNNPSFFAWRWKRLEHASLHRRVVRAGDDLVIEGFPRSANTFATYAFMQANAGRSLKIGNHFHSPAQFRLAARYGVPAMLVIREPLDAILSLMVFTPHMSARDGLRRYIGFHEPLLALSDRFVVAPFAEVTTDFDRSIMRLNQRFGLDFALFNHTQERSEALQQWIDRDRTARAKDHPELLGDPMKRPLPSPEKAAARISRQRDLARPELEPLRVRANGLFRQLTGS